MTHGAPPREGQAGQGRHARSRTHPAQGLHRGRTLTTPGRSRHQHRHAVGRAHRITEERLRRDDQRLHGGTSSRDAQPKVPPGGKTVPGEGLPQGTEIPPHQGRRSGRRTHRRPYQETRPRQRRLPVLVCQCRTAAAEPPGGHRHRRARIHRAHRVRSHLPARHDERLHRRRVPMPVLSCGDGRLPPRTPPSRPRRPTAGPDLGHRRAHPRAVVSQPRHPARAPASRHPGGPPHAPRGCGRGRAAPMVAFARAACRPTVPRAEARSGRDRKAGSDRRGRRRTQP